MYNIAICDDEEASLTIIEGKLKEEFTKRGAEIRVNRYSSSNGIEKAIERGQEYDVIFLDIVMPKRNGIELGKWLRQTCPGTLLVYISSRNELVFKTFKARPFSFLRKSHIDNELPGLVEDLMEEISARNSMGNQFEVMLDNKEIVKFNAVEVMYIEVIGKNCRVVSESREKVTKCRLSAYEEVLMDKGFIKVHKSFLVNYRYIFQIKNKEIILDNGEELPVSKYRLKEVKEEFMKLLGGTE